MGKFLGFRAFIFVLLLLHVLAHPLVHGLCASPAPLSGTRIALPSATTNTANSLDDCSLCRAGQTTMPTASIPTTERLNPQWIPIRLQAVSYASLRIDGHLPSRAPPSL